MIFLSSSSIFVKQIYKMSIRALTFFLFLVACTFNYSIRASSEEHIKASLASPSSSPNHQDSPVAATENMTPTTPKKLSPRYARKIPKVIDEMPITLEHKQMLSVHDKIERPHWDAKRAKDVKKEKIRKMTRTGPNRYVIM